MPKQENEPIVDNLISIFAILSLIAMAITFGFEFLFLFLALCLLIVLGPALVIHLNHRYRMKQRRGE